MLDNRKNYGYTYSTMEVIATISFIIAFALL